MKIYAMRRRSEKLEILAIMTAYKTEKTYIFLPRSEKNNKLYVFSLKMEKFCKTNINQINHNQILIKNCYSKYAAPILI